MDTRKTNLLKTGLSMLLIILLMALIFNFTFSLSWEHEDMDGVNMVIWPIQQFSELLTYRWFGWSGHFADAFAFFITELPYVYMIMIAFGYIFNFARSFSTDKEVSDWLSTRSGFSGRILGSIAGFISPFCSCSTIPVMTTLAKSKAPFGTVVAFLITSPMISESGIALMWSFFGYKVALLYILFGFIIGIGGSYIATFLKLSDQFKLHYDEEIPHEQLERTITLKYMHKRAWKESKSAFKKVWWIMIVALAIGAVMHSWIPDEWIEDNVGNNWWAPLVMVPIGAALYLNVNATLPITDSFVASGLGLGPALSFTMGVNTLSFPEVIMLTKIFKRKFIYFFITYLLVAILIFAYILMAIPDSSLL